MSGQKKFLIYHPLPTINISPFRSLKFMNWEARRCECWIWPRWLEMAVREILRNDANELLLLNAK